MPLLSLLFENNQASKSPNAKHIHCSGALLFLQTPSRARSQQNKMVKHLIHTECRNSVIIAGEKVRGELRDRIQKSKWLYKVNLAVQSRIATELTPDNVGQQAGLSWSQVVYLEPQQTSR